jgi:lipopolysaccharide/colanic/teichoic acid biosynthesis glycosyltransferase
MSLGGPRPALPVQALGWEDRHRLQIPMGSTGVWQVSGRSEVSFDDRMRRDLFYIEN